MRADPHERQLGIRSATPIRVWHAVLFLRQHGILPSTPVSGGAQPHLGIGMLHLPGVSGQQVTISILSRYAVAEVFPRLGKKRRTP